MIINLGTLQFHRLIRCREQEPEGSTPAGPTRQGTCVVVSGLSPTATDIVPLGRMLDRRAVSDGFIGIIPRTTVERETSSPKPAAARSTFENLFKK